LAGAAQLTTAAQMRLSQINSQLVDLRRDLDQVAQHFSVSASPGGDGAARGWYETCPALAGQLARDPVHLLNQLERAVSVELFGGESNLRRELKLDVEARGQLPAILRAAARSVILSELKTSRTGRETSGWGVSSELMESMRRAANLARPPWLDCGGALRRLVVWSGRGGANQRPEIFEQALGGPTTMLCDAQEETLIAFEAEQIPLREIAARLSDGHPDVLQLAERLHTRVDVNWSPLT
jgi:hypothetical protein